jgi:hypothetical protein
LFKSFWREALLVVVHRSRGMASPTAGVKRQADDELSATDYETFHKRTCIRDFTPSYFMLGAVEEV